MAAPPPSSTSGSVGPGQSTAEAYRSCLRQGVLFMLKQEGFSTVSTLALDKLTAVYEEMLCQMAGALHVTTEHCGRTRPMFPDAVVALSDLGVVDLRSLPAYVRTCPATQHVPPPQSSAQSSQAKGLTSGKKHSFPAYIPDYMVEFPDPHTYTKTPIYKKPISDYEGVRDKYAHQKLNAEMALTKYITHTSQSIGLFGEENESHLIIKSKSNNRPYLSALITPDSKLHGESKTDTQNSGKKRPSSDADKSQEEGDADGTKSAEADVKNLNPFLAPCKFPGARQTKKKGAGGFARSESYR